MKNALGAVMGWNPIAGTQLVADFDDGTVNHDALGNLINRVGLGLGSDEGMTSPGDSSAEVSLS